MDTLPRMRSQKEVGRTRWLLYKSHRLCLQCILFSIQRIIVQLVRTELTFTGTEIVARYNRIKRIAIIAYDRR